MEKKSHVPNHQPEKIGQPTLNRASAMGLKSIPQEVGSYWYIVHSIYGMHTYTDTYMYIWNILYIYIYMYKFGILDKVYPFVEHPNHFLV